MKITPNGPKKEDALPRFTEFAGAVAIFNSYLSFKAARKMCSQRQRWIERDLIGKNYGRVWLLRHTRLLDWGPHRCRTTPLCNPPVPTP